MSTSEAPPGVRPLIIPMRWLLYAASTLVFLAGLQLTVFTEQTATYFAWTIMRPLTAAFLGASYWAAVPVEIIAARQSTWASARVAVPAIWLFTTLTLVTTLLHFDLFHFSPSAVLSAQAAAWFWLAIYVGVPVAMLLIWILQVRAPGTDPARGPPAPAWMRFLVLGQGVGMLAVGVALFLAPDGVKGGWPWGLTTLTARATVAWLIVILAPAPPVAAAGQIEVYKTGLNFPIALVFSSDGRIFFAEKTTGSIRIIYLANRTLLPTAFITLPSTDGAGERGLLGLALDPGFPSTPYVYAYQTYNDVTNGSTYNRIVRILASGNVGVSYTVILRLPPLSSATNHNGGVIEFGPDGKLFAVVGE